MSAKRKGTSKNRVKKSVSKLSKVEARKQARARFAEQDINKQENAPKRARPAALAEQAFAQTLRSSTGLLSLLPATLSIPIPRWKAELQRQWVSNHPKARRKAVHLLEKAAAEPDVEKCLTLLQKALAALGFDETQICHLVVGLYYERLVTVREKAIVDVCAQVYEAFHVFGTESEPQERKERKHRAGRRR